MAKHQHMLGGLVLALAACLSAPALAEDLQITTLAGPSNTDRGWDGIGDAARFNGPQGVAVDGAGNVYVADEFNHCIRKITPTGAVLTLAGGVGSAAADGTGAAAQFSYPRAVAVDGNGNVYVPDPLNHTIRKVTPAGVVTTLAGLAGTAGSTDGTGSAARFYNPGGVAADGSGNIYVGDTENHTIRKITPAGDVTTLAGLAGSSGSADGTGAAARFNYPRGMAVDGSGNVYVADTSNSTIRKITPAGDVTTLAGLWGLTGSTDGTGTAARFKYPSHVAVDGSANVYVADSGNLIIRKITPGGDVTTLAGLAGSSGAMDGTGSAARFANPTGVAVDSSGTVYVGDSANNTIRKVTPAGDVTTWAGQAATGGSVDGAGSAARFCSPVGVAVDGSGSVYVADGAGSFGDQTFVGHTIRKITPAGAVTTFAGLAGTSGSTDGTGSAAQFYNPSGVAVDGSGTVYVADTSNNTIRKITPAGDVTTFTGLAGTSGSADGTGSAARFSYPAGVAVDGSGNVYVADSNNDTIRKITPAGDVTTLAGLAGSSGSADGTGSTARFNDPRGVAVDGSGNVYVADSANHTIRKITPAGDVTTLAGVAGVSGYGDGTGPAARFSYPAGLAVDGSGNIYVGDTSNRRIRKVAPAGAVTTLAGFTDTYSYVYNNDGTGTDARFSGPAGIAVAATGDVFIADTGNHSIRWGYPPILDHATIAPSDGAAGVARQLDTNPQTATAWQWTMIRQPAASPAALSSTSVRDPTFTPDIADYFVFRLVAMDAAGRRGASVIYLSTMPPAITSALSASGTVGQAFTYTITATEYPYSYTSCRETEELELS